jgi:hypothetical protein
MDKETVTLIIAVIGAVTGIWGAITGSIALAWDAVKWRLSGVRLNVRVQPGMIFFPGDHPLMQAIAPSNPEQRQVMIVVQNRGGKPTTLTGFGMTVYRSWLSELFRVQPQCFVFSPFRTTQPIPYLLDVGKEWIGCFDQTAEIERYIDQRCYVLVSSSTRTKPVWCRVKYPTPRKPGKTN